jgi:hypothetical protein
MDLVSANSTADTDSVSIFFQDAPRAYRPATLLPQDSHVAGIRGIATADLDQDGDLDIVTANEVTDNLAIYYQIDPGTFALQLPRSDLRLSSDGDPQAVVVADLNEDGALDLACACKQDEVALFLYDPAGGGFVAGASIQGLDGPESLAAADLDQDGKTDLAVANTKGNTLSLLIQGAPGAFTLTNTFADANGKMDQPRAVIAADLDRDGLVDLATANSSSANVTIFFATGPATFPAAAQALGDDHIGDARALAAADLDHDGAVDLVAGRRAGGGDDDALFVFRQVAPRIFRKPALRLLDDSLHQPRAILALDLDADGDLDLAAANDHEQTDPGSNNLTIFYGAPSALSR